MPLSKTFGNGTRVFNVSGAQFYFARCHPDLSLWIGICELRGCQSHHRSRTLKYYQSKILYRKYI